MDFLELKNISEQTMELVNPTSPEKIVRAGQILGLGPESRVIEFGTGYGEVLALWAQRFGVGGVGIDVRPHACRRAESKMNSLGLSDRIEIVCGNAAGYAFERGAYDLAACIGASFIWGGFRQAIRAMRPAIRPSGNLIFGEPYWLRSAVPPDYSRREAAIHTEYELLQIIREEGFELGYALHSSRDEWDRYEADNWQGLLRWLADNPTHPQREEVHRHLRESQDEYLRFIREYFGWALYLLYPATTQPVAGS